MAGDPLNTSAPYAFIMDGDNGIPLYSKRGDEADDPGFDVEADALLHGLRAHQSTAASRCTDEFTVSEHAWRTGGAGTDGSTMFLPLNSKVSCRDLLQAARSSSRATMRASCWPKASAGSEEAYARRAATARAKELGMTHSDVRQRHRAR